MLLTILIIDICNCNYLKVSKRSKTILFWAPVIMALKPWQSFFSFFFFFFWGGGGGSGSVGNFVLLNCFSFFFCFIALVIFFFFFFCFLGGGGEIRRFGKYDLVELFHFLFIFCAGHLERRDVYMLLVHRLDIKVSVHQSVQQFIKMF